MEKRAQGFLEKKNADRAEKQKERDEALAAAKEDPEKTPEEIATMEEENKETMVQWEKDREAEDADADENDPDRPNLEDMLEAERTIIKT